MYCSCCTCAHLLAKCQQFQRKKHREKIRFLKEKGICFGCLKVGHSDNPLPIRGIRGLVVDGVSGTPNHLHQPEAPAQREELLHGGEGGPGHQVDLGETQVLSPRSGVYPGHDHAPLKWMARAKDNNARVTRWFLALQDFHFKVDHRPGKEHANADALSRRDACLGWTPVDQRLHQAVKECDNLLPTRGIRGLVVDGVYRRHPLAGGREHHFPHCHQPDGEHLAGGRKRAGGHLKRRPRTHSRRRRTNGPEKAVDTDSITRGSRSPKYSLCIFCSLYYL